MALTVMVLANESLLLREDDAWLRVPCAWGVDPSWAFLPSLAHWDANVPSWLLGRRQEAAEAITNFGLVVRDDERPLSPWASGHGEITYPSADPVPDSEVIEVVHMDEFRRSRR